MSKDKFMNIIIGPTLHDPKDFSIKKGVSIEFLTEKMMDEKALDGKAVLKGMIMDEFSEFLDSFLEEE